ncbi:MAG: ABC transporter ATP-binding protein [Cohaesibacteraceae bacterium]|nr:ABC transporter ATP-binding protein [Cohaesibacteraceae bacterium]
MSIQGNAASVRFHNVTKIYGQDIVAVDDVSFLIKAGSLVTLLGPSGCGKTTTLRMIAGLEMVNSGNITIGDVNVTKLPATDRDVSMVFQSYALFPHMTVGENVAYGLNVSGVKKSVAQDKANDGLKLVGLEGYMDRLPSELSGGQQQRVAVARALVLEPQVLLFDEPLSNLDAKLRRKVREEIRDIQRNLGLTVVYVTHDQEEALAVSDRIIVMKNAVIAQEGAPRDLYSCPENLFVADFIGDANLLEVEITSIDGPIAQITVGSLNIKLDHRGMGLGGAHIAIRPASILISVDMTGGGLDGTISKATYLGGHMEYTILTELGELFVINSDVYSPFAINSSVKVSLSKHGVTLVND